MLIKRANVRAFSRRLQVPQAINSVESGRAGFVTTRALKGSLMHSWATGARSTQPALYWVTIVATTLADFVDRSRGLAMPGAHRCCPSRSGCHWPSGRGAWHRIGRYRGIPQGRDVVLGDEHVLADIGNRARRLGSAYGRDGIPRRDDDLWRALLATMVAAHYWTRMSRTTPFWAAFILTRPLGARRGRLA